MKKTLSLILTCILLMTACLATAEGPGRRGGFGGGGRGGMGGMADKSGDSALQAILSEVSGSFQLMTYVDPQNGNTLQYQLFLPADYDEDNLYPLLQFIPDSSVVGKGAEAVLTQGWGGVIWATAEEQAKHPCIIVIPIFTETIVDDNFYVSSQVETDVRLIEYLMSTYAIDPDRIYTTGQSMGGMTSFHLNITYPDLFAASLFVGSQWDISQMKVLEGDTFFYIVAAGDPKASAGQTELLDLFEKDQVPYSHAQWSAQDDAQSQDAQVEALLEEGNRANFITFTLGSTLDGASTGNSPAGEHMTSFDYAYRLTAVRDWLFAQSK
ncbi:MAG: pyrroline-5-carboxylate reductase [Clostridia bacterium]|nr:pyrroline-5-carboxylate reductase [Clostridia bacterium]